MAFPLSVASMETFEEEFEEAEEEELEEEEEEEEEAVVVEVEEGVPALTLTTTAS